MKNKIIIRYKIFDFIGKKVWKVIDCKIKAGMAQYELIFGKKLFNISRKNKTTALIGLFSASDIFLYPTREENQGIAFLEAIMYDKPAIISDHPVFEEYKENFHVLKASTIDEFVEKIEMLSTDHKLRRKLIENSKSYLKVHDIKKSVKAISDLYTSKLE